MRIVVCDDEMRDAEAVADILKDQVLTAEDELELVLPDSFVSDAWRKEKKYDIAVLDIDFHRDDLDGIQVGAMLNRYLPNCQIIYLTGILDYASEVYETKHCYFVQKKNQNVTLKRAFDKAKKVLADDAEEHVLRLVSDGKEQFLKTADIRYIQREGRKTRVCGVVECMSYESLSGIALRLPGYFVRCHTGYIVNLHHVSSANLDRVVMSDGIEIPIGKTLKHEFMKEYLQYISRRT